MNIAIVDVCSGNLRSVERALTKVGASVTVTRDPEAIRRADKIVVPGQGAFGVFMQALGERGLGEVLREVIARGTPYLGICLGMQVLFESSEETAANAEGTVTGLGLIKGTVVRLRPEDPTLKVPHIGWNRVTQTQREPLFARVPDEAYFYFVHSFHAVPADASTLVGTTEHGSRVTAAVRKDNVFACQFHPEKSQAVGLALLGSFVQET